MNTSFQNDSDCIWSRRAVLAGIGAFALPSGTRSAVPGSAGPVLAASRFATLAAAVEHWADVGGTLMIDRDFVVPAPITMKARSGLAYRLTTDRRRRLRYTGPRYHWALCLYSTGETPFAIDGNLTIDGGNHVSMVFFARFENVSGTARRDFTVDGLSCVNARVELGISPVDGNPANAYGACGMLFLGGFDRLHLRNVAAANVTRAARSGVPSSRGSLGIGVVSKLGSTISARHVTIEDFSVSHIDSDDAPSSPYRMDMDGVLVFQSSESGGTRPVIRRGVIREAAGRAVKMFAPGGGGETRNLAIYRSVPSMLNGAVDIHHQHGDGLISDIDLFYSGRAHDLPTTSISVGTGSRRPEKAPGLSEIRNIRIHDTTGKAKGALFGIQYNVVGDKTARRYRISGVTDDGLARFFFLPGALGTHGPASILIEDVDVSLTGALLASEDPTQLLQVQARRARFSRAGRVPVKSRYDGQVVHRSLAVGVDADASVLGLRES